MVPQGIAGVTDGIWMRDSCGMTVGVKGAGYADR